MDGGRRLSKSARIERVRKRAQMLAIQTKAQQGKAAAPPLGVLKELHAELQELVAEFHDVVVDLADEGHAPPPSKPSRPSRTSPAVRPSRVKPRRPRR